MRFISAGRKQSKVDVRGDGLLKGTNGECRRLCGDAATRVCYSNKADDDKCNNCFFKLRYQCSVA